MATTTTAAPVELPSIEAVELADWKIGSLMSDLDVMETMLEKVRVEPDTVEEYLANPDAYGPQEIVVDAETMLRLYVFCDELDSDGRRLIEYGKKFRALIQGAYSENVRDTRPRLEVGREAMLNWHRESVQALGGGDA